MRAKLEDILSGVVSDDVAKIIYNTQGLELSCDEIGFQRCFNMWWPASCEWVVEWEE